MLTVISNGFHHFGLDWIHYRDPHPNTKIGPKRVILYATICLCWLEKSLSAG